MSTFKSCWSKFPKACVYVGIYVLSSHAFSHGKKNVPKHALECESDAYSLRLYYSTVCFGINCIVFDKRGCRTPTKMNVKM